MPNSIGGFKPSEEEVKDLANETANHLNPETFVVENSDGNPGATVTNYGDVTAIHDHASGHTYTELADDDKKFV